MLRRVVLFLFITFGFPTASPAYDVASMVISSKGALPLILTVPHDGGEFLGLLPVRTKGAIVRDAGTRELAERVAALIEKRTGKRSYVVIANFSRKHLDANRSEQDSMESHEALPAYRAYHDQISTFVAEVRSKFPTGALLLDVHGQSDDQNTTFQGTRSGLTTKSLLQRFGPATLQGSKSIVGVLAAKRYQVNPPVGIESLEEDRRFVGGFTVYQYGSHRADGIDAIQLEFGKKHRADHNLAENFAEAIIVFMTEYEFLQK